MKKSVLVLFVVLLLFISACSLPLSNISVDPSCEKKAREMMGDQFIIRFLKDSPSGTQMGGPYTLSFPKAKTGQLSGQHDVRTVYYGKQIGQNTSQLYGSFVYKKTHNKRIIENDIILGNNKFDILIEIDEVNNLYEKIGKPSINGPYLVWTLPNTREYITITSCNFVN